MLYIHKLADFNEKSVDIESITVIRDLKSRVGFPVTLTYFERLFDEHYVSEEDILLMENSHSLIEPTVQMVKGFIDSNNILYEPISLKRIYQVLNSIPNDFSNNLAYAKEMFLNQKQIVGDLIPLLNAIPSLKLREEKVAVNDKLNLFFDKVLRHREPRGDLNFFYFDIIHEGHLSGLSAIEEGLKKGFIFHITLEEELKKTDFFDIKGRIPADILKSSEDLEKNIFAIRKGVQKAYMINMHMLNFAMMMYSCIKWVSARSVQY